MIETESQFFHALVHGNLKPPLPAREHFSPLWQNVWDWFHAETLKIGRTPSYDALMTAWHQKAPVFAGLAIAEEPITYYIDIILKNSARVAIENKLSQLVPTLDKPFESIAKLKDIAHELSERFRDKQSGLVLDDISQRTDLRYKDYQRRSKAKMNVAIPFGPWDTISNNTMGFKSGELWTILARPAKGKTTLACVVANHLFRLGFRILFVSMETPPHESQAEDNLHRVIMGRCIRCCEEGVKAEDVCEAAEIPRQQLTQVFDFLGASISRWRLLSGTLTPTEEDALQAYYEAVSNRKDYGWGDLKVVAYPEISTLGEIEMESRAYKPDLLIVDSAYLAAKPKKGQGTTEACMEFVQGLNKFVKRKGQPCLVTWHFNREVEDDSIDASYNQAQYTDEIGKASDYVIGQFRSLEMEAAETAMLRMLKTRTGTPVRELPINFRMKNDVSFSELPVQVL